MRILQIAPRYPPRTGGVETHVSEISERLADRGHDVTVRTADAGPDVPTHESKNGVDIVRHRSVAPDSAIHFAPRITTAVRRSDVDIVHAHNYHSLPLLFAALGAGTARLVVTPHYHGRSSDRTRNGLLSAYRLVGRWALKRADAVIAVSDWERNRLRSDFGIESVVIPNGLNIDRFVDASPATRPRPYLLTVGRLEEYKGIQFAIQALPELSEYDLLVAGSGPYREELERTASEVGVRDRVEFLGYVSENRLPGLYAGATVFLNLSTLEAYGMTVAEAIAAGTPCVVREAGALSDWTATHGVIGIDQPTTPTLTSAIETVSKCTPARDDLLSWEHVTDCIEALYEDVISTRSQTPQDESRGPPTGT